MDFDFDDMRLGIVWCIVIAWAAVMLGAIGGALFMLARIVMGLL